MKSIIIFSILLIFPHFSKAYAQWIELNDPQTKQCQKENPCVLIHEKTKNRFPITFEFDKKGTKIDLKKVNVLLLNGKQQSFDSLENFQSHYEDEKLGLYAADYNSDGFLDFAIEASRGARLGSFYFYWIYNPTSKEFVQTPEQLEKMLVIKENVLKTVNSGELYKVGKDFKIVAQPATKTKK